MPMVIDEGTIGIVGGVIGIIVAGAPVMFFVGRLVQLPKTIGRLHTRITDLEKRCAERFKENEERHDDLVQQLIYTRAVQPPALRRSVTSATSLVNSKGEALDAGDT